MSADVTKIDLVVGWGNQEDDAIHISKLDIVIAWDPTGTAPARRQRPKVRAQIIYPVED
jgi:hypothetical protein